jgi:hypothetical protein
MVLNISPLTGIRRRKKKKISEIKATLVYPFARNGVCSCPCPKFHKEDKKHTNILALRHSLWVR